MILQYIKCDVCGKEARETKFGEGFKGWGGLNGITLNEIQNPCLCPEHLREAANYIDTLAKRYEQ